VTESASRAQGHSSIVRSILRIAVAAACGGIGSGGSRRALSEIAAGAESVENRSIV
jgi:hypothetical protein